MMQMTLSVTRLNTFKKYSEALQKNLDSAVADVVRGLVAEAKKEAPVDTGALRASIYGMYVRRGGNTVHSGYEAASMASARRAALYKSSYGVRSSHTIMPEPGNPVRWQGIVAAGAAYAEFVEYGQNRFFMTRTSHQFERQAVIIVDDWVRRTRV